ncbi:helix-turn-helix domain-containing protein [Streptomyces sp. NPDC093089]|uniref:helix-turn-helix domain-containing protein n=1 Tax=Streptomyces sp. NPDC093089 TaxID=3366024 RepID=UPI0037F41108
MRNVLSQGCQLPPGGPEADPTLADKADSSFPSTAGAPKAASIRALAAPYRWTRTAAEPTATSQSASARPWVTSRRRPKAPSAAQRANQPWIRLQAVEGFEGGQKNRETAGALRVSERSVERWRRRLADRLPTAHLRAGPQPAGEHLVAGQAQHRQPGRRAARPVHPGRQAQAQADPVPPAPRRRLPRRHRPDRGRLTRIALSSPIPEGDPPP